MRLVLPVLLIVPAVVLFGLQRQSNGDDSAFVATERHGVAYLRGLVPLEIELVGAQVAAAAGTPVQREPLVAAIGAAAKADGDYGAELLAHDRWTDVRAKIEGVPATGSPATVFAAYSEALDLLLDLADKVRDASGLARDPHAETFYLADGGAQELPEGIAAAGQYAGRVLLARQLAQSAQTDALFGIAEARSDLISSASDLSEDMQLASQGPAGTSLDAGLLAKIDAYSRAADSLVPAAASARTTFTADPAQITNDRNDLGRAGSALSAALLSVLDNLLRDREASLRTRAAVAVAVLVAAIVLGLVPVTLAVVHSLRGRRRRTGAAGGPPSGPPPAEAPHPAAERWPDDYPARAPYERGESVRAAR
ncbi:hypothetical protein GCM10018962_79300 [Dactylosporangium matsuzakiense]|uniref:Nitrate/nitrite sensing protein domain-containing protein n=1 Tax=Dactylosporangium matsuzakiense TaxID=53360 RepID=A0A9W6KLH3_9ACTN|nr:hypothetical protein GCM10017581_034160 [Dactylosporangium matsuzakiense]